MKGPRHLPVVVALVVLLVACCGGLAAAETDSQPGEPASFYGEATESNGTDIPAGVEIVAVVDGDVVDEITVEPDGEYGGPGAFDDKLRVDSTAGDEVTFRLVGPNGSAGGTTPLESGVFEENLTFPEGSVESLPPAPSIDVDPDVATTDDSIRFSAAGSTAHDDTELAAFEWTIERDGESIDTVNGEVVERTVEEAGEYDVVLTVTDADGRTATETSGFEVESTGDSAESNGGGGSSTGAGGGGAGGGGGGGTGGAGGDSGGGSGGGGGGGGGSMSRATDGPTASDPVRTATRRIEDQSPASPGTTVAFEGTAVREIVFENRPADGEISIAEFETPTAGAPPLPDGRNAASAVEITVPDAYIETDATIRAFVSEEWVTEQGYAPEHLTVYRLPDGGDRWEPLPTEATETDGGYLVKADTPGFSQFVIAGRVPPSGESGGTEAPSDSDRTGSEGQTENGSPKQLEAEESSGATVFDPTSPFVPLAALCALLVVVAAIGRLFIPRRRDEW